MTHRKARSNSGDPTALLTRKIRLSRVAMILERVWPALWPPFAVVGVFLIVSLLGFWQAVPAWAHVVGLALTGLALVAALVPLGRVRLPGRDEARARLDRHDILRHRPATAFEDRLASGESTAGRALWAAHRARVAEQIASLKVRLPEQRLMQRDPFALRVIILLGLVVAATYAGPDWRSRLMGSVAPTAVAAIEPVRLDAWITPPAYTGRPPVFLADGAQSLTSLEPSTKPYVVPDGSNLVLRFHGGETASVTLTPANGGDPQTFAYAATADSAEFTAEIAGDTLLEVSRTETEPPLRWVLSGLADKAPRIDLAEDVSTTADQALKLVYSVNDDYGVVEAEARFAIPPGEEDDAGEAAAQPGGDATPNLDLELKIEPPDFALVLPGVRVRDAVSTMFRDLTAHPWAGIDVEMTLIARDEAGQEGLSDMVAFRLPERRFRNPLAKAVIEQRRNLVRRPAAFPRVARALNALTIAPERYIEDHSIYLGLRVAYLRTRNIETSEQLREAVDLMWDIALRIEDGDLSLAERELRAAQEALARALAENASDEEIERLMDELRDALGRFLQALRDQAERMAENGQPMPQMNGDEVESQDLSQMMDMIEQLAKSGARDAAQQLLSQLQNLLESLNGAAMAQMSPEQSMMSQMLDELGRMIQEQQRLMDDTFQQNQQGGQQGQQQGEMQMPGQQGGAPGQQGQQGPGNQPGSGMSLAQRQEAIRDALRRLQQQLGQGGVDVPGPLDRAGESMGQAGESLREGMNGQALGQQREALDQLRQGAQSMAQQLAEGMNPGPGQGEPGQAGANGPTDPLGRPLRTTGPEFGLSVKVPDEIDAEAARRLREELQRRLGNRERRELELDYIERLLERF